MPPVREAAALYGADQKSATKVFGVLRRKHPSSGFWFLFALLKPPLGFLLSCAKESQYFCSYQGGTGRLKYFVASRQDSSVVNRHS
jgi:hypothetical protein